MAKRASSLPPKNQKVKGFQGKPRPKKANSKITLLIVIVVIVLGLLVVGAFQVLGGRGSAQAAIQVDEGSLQSTSIEAGQEQTSVVAEVDQEDRYLGPESDPETLLLAEAGQIGKPTLVWFHADWCQICQRVKPEVVQLGQAYEGKVQFVRINLSRENSRAAVQRLGVRATPTFVLFDAEGQIRGNVPGWPGYNAFTSAFEQLLPQS
jgi:thiol-disulfide isomerase/thioredoxin